MFKLAMCHPIRWYSYIISCMYYVAESPNLMPSQGYLSSDTKYPRGNTKLMDSVEHTARENSKIHIFTSGSQMRE
jgi:hypothetical protein